MLRLGQILLWFSALSALGMMFFSLTIIAGLGNFVLLRCKTMKAGEKTDSFCRNNSQYVIIVLLAGFVEMLAPKMARYIRLVMGFSSLLPFQPVMQILMQDLSWRPFHRPITKKRTPIHF